MYLILVPASDVAPHGVQYNERFLWPVREDRTTRAMREPELATRYRDRFAGVQRQAARIDEVSADGTRNLSANAWLAISLAPAKGGHLIVDKESHRQWLRTHFESVPWGLAVDAGAALGRRKVIFTDQYQYAGYSTDHHIELHADGAGFAAINLSGSEPRPGNADGLDHPETTCYVKAESIAVWTTAFLNLLARHAVRTGGASDLAVRAELLRGATRLTNSKSRAVPALRPLSVSEVILRDSMDVGTRVVPGSRLLQELTPLDTVVPTTITTTTQDLIAAAAEIANELVVEFNAPPTNPALTPDGYVNDWPVPFLAGLRGWAQQHGVLKSDA